MQQLEFVELVADTFDIGPDHTHIGALTFASDTKVVFHLDTFNNRVDVKQAIRREYTAINISNTNTSMVVVNSVPSSRI